MPNEVLMIKKMLLVFFGVIILSSCSDRVSEDFFVKENEKLWKEVSLLKDEVKKLKGDVKEISTLRELFSSVLLSLEENQMQESFDPFQSNSNITPELVKATDIPGAQEFTFLPRPICATHVVDFNFNSSEFKSITYFYEKCERSEIINWAIEYISDYGWSLTRSREWNDTTWELNFLHDNEATGKFFRGLTIYISNSNIEFQLSTLDTTDELKELIDLGYLGTPVHSLENFRLDYYFSEYRPSVEFINTYEELLENILLQEISEERIEKILEILLEKVGIESFTWLVFYAEHPVTIDNQFLNLNSESIDISRIDPECLFYEYPVSYTKNLLLGEYSYASEFLKYFNFLVD